MIHQSPVLGSITVAHNEVGKGKLTCNSGFMQLVSRQENRRQDLLHMRAARSFMTNKNERTVSTLPGFLVADASSRVSSHQSTRSRSVLSFVAIRRGRSLHGIMQPSFMRRDW